MSQALGIIKVRAYISNEKRGTHSQTALRHLTAEKVFKYYDGMVFGPDHTLLTPPQPFTRRQVDRDRTKEFRKTVKLFREALPLLHAACPSYTTFSFRGPTPDELDIMKGVGINHWHCPASHEIRIAMQTPELWPLVVRQFRCETHEQTWVYLYRVATADLTEQTPDPL